MELKIDPKHRTKIAWHFQVIIAKIKDSGTQHFVKNVGNCDRNKSSYFQFDRNYFSKLKMKNIYRVRRGQNTFQSSTYTFRKKYWSFSNYKELLTKVYHYRNIKYLRLSSNNTTKLLPMVCCRSLNVLNSVFWQIYSFVIRNSLLT